MASCSLNDQLSDQKSLSSLLDLRDQLYNKLSQAVALAVVANGEDFLNFNEPLIHDYLALLQELTLAALDTYRVLDERLGQL